MVFSYILIIHNYEEEFTVEAIIMDTLNGIEKPLYKGHTLSLLIYYTGIFQPLREDNLSVKDEMAGLNVSIIRRLHWR